MDISPSLLEHDAPSHPLAIDDVTESWRRNDGSGLTCVLVNSSPHDAYDVPIPMAGDAVSELMSGLAVPVIDDADLDCSLRIGAHADRYALAHLGPLGSAMLHFHPQQRFGCPMEPGVGVLAHITSIPANGPGTLGEPARRFIDWLAEAGVRYWQILPVNPTDKHGSPYAGISAFAGNIRLLEGGADAIASTALENPDEYAGFCEREADWLESYSAFMAIHEKLGFDLSWQNWPARYRHFDPISLEGDEELRVRAEKWRRLQFAFERQWQDVRAYANDRGVRIIGDMPIYVNADSADAWANPSIFQLEPDGTATVVAGCPPDNFAPDGQIWFNPIYDWNACETSGYRWWLRRLQRAFALYDMVRLDHFIGFSQYYSIPVGQAASAGAYHQGPGIELFRRAYEELGPLPIIAEDLGLVTPAVRALSADCGFPGMDIVQFADGNNPLSSYQPRPEKIVYTGTHDNQTLVGYCQRRYPHLDARETAEAIREKVVTCAAPVCILPLQDILLLGDEARMNTPGTAEGNWAWQADSRSMRQALEPARKLVSLHESAGRRPA